MKRSKSKWTLDQPLTQAVIDEIVALNFRIVSEPEYAAAITKAIEERALSNKSFPLMSIPEERPLALVLYLLTTRNLPMPISDALRRAERRKRSRVMNVA